MFKHAGDEVIGERGDAAAVRIFAIHFEQVLARGQIRQGHVVVRAAAGALRRRLGHEGGKGTVLAGDLVGHHAEEHEAVGHGQRVGVLEVGFELAVGVFMVERVHAPAHLVHGFHQLIDHRQIVHQQTRVVAGLGRGIAIAERGEAAVRRVLEQEELGLDAEVEGVAQRCGGFGLALEDAARAGVEGLAVQVEVAGEPGEIAVPAALGGGRRVWHRGHLVVADLLRDAVQRRTGVELGAAEHLAEMGDGDELAFDHAVHVDVAGHGVLHALVLQPLFQLLDGGEGKAGHLLALLGVMSGGAWHRWHDSFIQYTCQRV